MEDKTSGGVANLRERSEAGEVVDHRSRGESAVRRTIAGVALIGNPAPPPTPCRAWDNSDRADFIVDPLADRNHRSSVWGEGNGKDDRTSAFDDLPSAVVIAGASITGSGNMVQKEMDTKRNGRINSGGLLLPNDLYRSFTYGLQGCVGFFCWVKELNSTFLRAALLVKTKGRCCLHAATGEDPNPTETGFGPETSPEITL
nr:hypothetical protein Iba_chr10dCG12140 [Ipomoea batatas]